MEAIYLKEEEFGKLAFCKRNTMNDLTEGTGANRRVTHKCYTLYGTKHAGGLEVFVPEEANVPPFESDVPVKLVDPKVVGRTQRSNNGSIIRWVVIAANILSV